MSGMARLFSPVGGGSVLFVVVVGFCVVVDDGDVDLRRVLLLL